MFQEYKIKELSWALLLNLVLLFLMLSNPIFQWVSSFLIAYNLALFFLLIRKHERLPLCIKIRVKRAEYLSTLVAAMSIGVIVSKSILGGLVAALLIHITLSALSIGARVPEFIILRERERNSLSELTNANLIRLEFITSKALKSSKRLRLTWLSNSLSELRENLTLMHYIDMTSLPDFTQLLGVEKLLSESNSVSEAQELSLRGVVNRINSELKKETQRKQ